MSAKKRIKSSKKPTKKDKHALSPIEKELLAYCEKRQPVLLHGNDDYDREKLVKRIHLLNGGEERSWEYQGDGDLHNEIKKIWVAVTETSSWDDGKRERVNKLLSDCDDTIRTYRSFNDTFEIYRSGNKDDFLCGQEVFKGLTSFGIRVLSLTEKFLSGIYMKRILVGLTILNCCSIEERFLLIIWDARMKIRNGIRR